MDLPRAQGESDYGQRLRDPREVTSSWTARGARLCMRMPGASLPPSANGCPRPDPSSAVAVSPVISRAPRPWVTKLNDQRINTSRRFWKPMRYHRWPTNQMIQARLPPSLSRLISATALVFLTYQQYQLIRSHEGESVRDMLDVRVGTGLRFAELTALQVGDVDVLAKPHPMLRVRRAWKTDEKGRRAKLGPPKTRRPRRTVQLTPDLAEILIPHIGGRASDEFVFTSPGGKAWWRHNFYNRCWKPAIDEAKNEGLEVRPRIRDLRHTHVSWLIAQGVQLTAISRRLGHESITTTIDRYGHLLPEVDDGLVKALAVAMDG